MTWVFSTVRVRHETVVAAGVAVPLVDTLMSGSVGGAVWRAARSSSCRQELQ